MCPDAEITHPWPPLWLGPAACTVNRAAMSDLLLKRATAAVGEVYYVIYEDKIVGRITFSAPSVDPLGLDANLWPPRRPLTHSWLRAQP